jgi:hypothetical protein
MTTTRYLTLQLAARRQSVRPQTARPETARRRRLGGDRGEGVISAAIAVLVMAFLGVAMWVGLNTIWNTAEANTAEQVNEIGQ